jgi:hypothetical protein
MVQTTPKPVPAYFAYGALDTLVPLQHQGDNMAQVWAIDRNDYAITPNDSRGTWYEGEDYADHYFNLANSNGLALALWLTKCLGGTI